MEMTSEEIKKVIFKMDNNKASSSNGFGTYIFKRAWDIIGKEVVETTLNPKPLKELNCTIIALILKCSNPTFCKDF